MNALQTYQSLLAARDKRAVPKTSRRHVHLSDQPLVLVGYHLAGDPGAPLALVWGTNPAERPRCVVVPEPRNRGLRFEALGDFATDLLDYLSHFEDRDESGMCLDAPQLVVPNSGTQAWLGGIVGRFTRNVRTDGDSPAPVSVPLAGKHLSFLADPMPGRSLVLSATDALCMHWQTGQLPSEDLNLAALLGWIEPPADSDGPRAARVGEESPPAGPDSDPHWDARVLEALVQDWHAAEDDAWRARVRGELESEIREQLSLAWSDCWRTLDCLAALPVAEHVSSRWDADRREWTRHCDRIAEGRAYFRNIPTPLQDATRLRILEDRTEDLHHEMAWDDSLVMAAAVASGEALAGRVVATEPERRTRNRNGNTVRRPLITIEPAIEFDRPAGTALFLSNNPGVMLEVEPAEAGGLMRAEVLKGANQTRTIGLLPGPGDDIVLSPFGQRDLYPRTRIDEIPWTHDMPLDDGSEEPE